MTAVAARLAAPPAPPGATRRPDIQGVRALAVGLVLLYHAGAPWLPGGYVGVDVFFVISGYVVTARLAQEVRENGRVRLLEFWSRRIRRLVPAAAVAIAATGILTVLFLPMTRWSTIAGDMVASAGFAMNLRLGARAVDYLAAGAADSPLQHLWSLGVEAQFYVAWGLLVAASALSLRRVRSPHVRRRLTILALAGFVVASLALSAWSLRDSTPAEYFSPALRFWEIGLGGLLAWRVVPRIASGSGSVRGPLRAVASTAGLLSILAGAVALTGRTPFPGVAALLPTVGAALVLWSGEQAGTLTSRLLAQPALVWLGDISYSLYLWHWPLLVVATAWWAPSGRALSPWIGMAVVAVSVAPAWASHRWVEHLADRLRPGVRSSVVLVLATSLAVCGGGAWAMQAAVPSVAVAPAGAGAAALGTDPRGSAAGESVDHIDDLEKLAAAAVGDVADVYGDGCHQDQVSSEPRFCVYGDPESTVTLVLVGDSHAAQWQPALRTLAERQHWRLETVTKSACPWAEAPVWLAEASSPYPSCGQWVDRVTQRLLDDPPTVVLTSSGPYAMTLDGAADHSSATPGLAQGLADAWERVSPAIPVVVLMDTPFIGLEIPDCLASHSGQASACAVERRSAVGSSAAPAITAAASDAAPSVSVVDLTDFVCPRASCAPVIGGVVVYRDSHHLTARYARTLATPLQAALEIAAPRLFE